MRFTLDKQQAFASSKYARQAHLQQEMLLLFSMSQIGLEAWWNSKTDFAQAPFKSALKNILGTKRQKELGQAEWQLISTWPGWRWESRKSALSMSRMLQLGWSGAFQSSFALLISRRSWSFLSPWTWPQGVSSGSNLPSGRTLCCTKTAPQDQVLVRTEVRPVGVVRQQAAYRSWVTVPVKTKHS